MRAEFRIQRLWHPTSAASAVLRLLRLLHRPTLDARRLAARPPLRGARCWQADKQHQLADWRVRPLPAELQAYARADTHHLLYIHDRLKVLPRGPWFPPFDPSGAAPARCSPCSLLPGPAPLPAPAVPQEPFPPAASPLEATGEWIAVVGRVGGVPRRPGRGGGAGGAQCSGGRSAHPPRPLGRAARRHLAAAPAPPRHPLPGLRGRPGAPAHARPAPPTQLGSAVFPVTECLQASAALGNFTLIGKRRQAAAAAQLNGLAALPQQGARTEGAGGCGQR